MEWVYLILAGCFEVVGVDNMNRALKKKTILSFAILFLGFGCSIFFLNLAMKTLPMGVSYAVWTGIGTVGGTAVGMLFHNEPKDLKRIFFIAMILAGVVGLKLTA